MSFSLLDSVEGELAVSYKGVWWGGVRGVFFFGVIVNNGWMDGMNG